MRESSDVLELVVELAVVGEFVASQLVVDRIGHLTVFTTAGVESRVLSEAQTTGQYVLDSVGVVRTVVDINTGQQVDQQLATGDQVNVLLHFFRVHQS